jgi:DNA-binding response OmpR family regulator
MERARLRRGAESAAGSGVPSPALPGQLPLRSASPQTAVDVHLPSVLVVAEEAAVRNAVARELTQDFELLNAITFTSAVRKLSARPSLVAIIVDLGLRERHSAPWFLARLVDHAYEGPRVLLSSVMAREEASTQRRGSVSHFTLARPWHPGELRASLESALGFYGGAVRPQDM